MLPQPNLQKMEGVSSPIPCEACSLPFSMAHLQDVHRKGVRRTEQTRQLPPTQTHFARRPCQSDSERGCSSMFMKVIKVKNVSAEPPHRSEIVFSHLDAEICFSGRGSYSSLMKRAIALVSIFPCKSNKLFGHGRRAGRRQVGAAGVREKRRKSTPRSHTCALPECMRTLLLDGKTQLSSASAARAFSPRNFS